LRALLLHALLINDFTVLRGCLCRLLLVVLVVLSILIVLVVVIVVLVVVAPSAVQQRFRCSQRQAVNRRV